MNTNKLSRKLTNWGSMAVGSHGEVTIELDETTKGASRWEMAIDAPQVNWRVAIMSPAIVTQLVDFLGKPIDGVENDEIQIGSIGNSSVWLRRDNEFDDRYLLVADSKDGRLDSQLTGQRIIDLQRSLEQIVADNDEIANWHASDSHKKSTRSIGFRFGLGSFLLIFTIAAIWFAIQSNKKYEDYRKDQAIAKTLEEFRQMLVTYSLDFDSVFPNKPLDVYNLKLLDRYPTKDAWPDALGPLPRRPSSKTTVLSSRGGEPIGSTGIVREPLTGSLAASKYATLILDQGETDQGKVSFTSYAYCISNGNIDGSLFMGSYGTVYIRGDLNGTVASDSYFAMMVEGKMTGHIETNSYAMIYLLGGFEGTLSLDNSRVYIAGETSEEDLKRVEGQGTIFLEKSDIPDGKKVGQLVVRIVGRAHK